MISGADDIPADYDGWIVKFPSREDSPDAGRIEYAYSEMARAAGIHMPPTRLFATVQGDAFFGAERFDRVAGERRHVHTFGNLIHANFRIPGCDYATLLRVTRILTRNQVDCVEAFRIMVFNVLAHNRDDHVKNVAFILTPDGDWHLAPAYDLTFSAGPGGEHAMTVAGEGKHPTLAHILQVARGEGIPERQAQRIVDEVAAAIADWPRHAAAASIAHRYAKPIGQTLRNGAWR